MSRNFELMQQVGRGSESASIPRARPVFSTSHEKVSTNRVRFGLEQVAREETLRLVQADIPAADAKGSTCSFIRWHRPG